ncbi:MAG: hypothetical protein IJC19_08060 [Clostridia bacterium]|nr:hypothetical protein [Clostridia bacterium]
MKKSILTFAVIGSVLFTVFLFSMHVSATESTTVYDSFNIQPEYLEAVKEHPDDVAIRCVTMIYAKSYAQSNKHSELKDLTSLEKVRDFYENEEEPIFYIRSANDGSVYIRGFNTSDKTVNSYSEDPVYYGQQRYLCFELLDHPEKIFPQGIVIEECYFFGARGIREGSFAYLVTNQGEFVVFSRYGSKSGEDLFVFPLKVFEKAVDRYLMLLKDAPLIMGHYDLCLASYEKMDFHDFTAPFDIEQYEKKVFLDHVKKVGEIGLVVLVVATVFVAAFFVPQKQKNDNENQEAPEPQSPAQGSQ